MPRLGSRRDTVGRKFMILLGLFLASWIVFLGLIAGAVWGVKALGSLLLG